MECTKLSGCAFVSKCKELGKSNAANGFISMYCKGDMMDKCIRLKLCNKFGKEAVPKNMMPTGYPLSGTDTQGWDEKALHYNKSLEE